METILLIGGLVGFALWAKGRATRTAVIGSDPVNPLFDGDEPDLGVDAYDYFPTSSAPAVNSKRLIFTGPDARPSRLSGLVGTRKLQPLQCGGGGPENAGALPINSDVRPLPFTQPSWWFESDDDYLGFALKSQTPLLAGGDPMGQQPPDAFRYLGDQLNGRQ